MQMKEKAAKAHLELDDGSDDTVKHWSNLACSAPQMETKWFPVLNSFIHTFVLLRKLLPISLYGRSVSAFMILMVIQTEKAYKPEIWARGANFSNISICTVINDCVLKKSMYLLMYLIMVTLIVLNGSYCSSKRQTAEGGFALKCIKNKPSFKCQPHDGMSAGCCGSAGRGISI